MMMDNAIDVCPPDHKADILSFSKAHEEWKKKPPGPAVGDYRSLRHLMSKTFPPIPWIVEDKLPPGLAVLAGPPKAGKSTLAIDLALAVSRGGAAFNALPCKAGRVLYHALEDSERRLRDRINGLWPDSQELSILFDYTMAAEPMPGFLEYLEQSLKDRRDTRFVVVDTWGVIAEDKGARASYKSDYGEAHKLQEIALRYDVTLMLIHHTRKMESGDVFADISGTYGLTGAADTLWVLKRKPDEPTGTLHIKGRDVEDNTFRLRFEDKRWLFEGDAPRINRTEEEQEIIELLTARPGGLLKGELQKATGLSPPALKSRLSRMQDRHLIECAPGNLWKLSAARQSGCTPL